MNFKNILILLIVVSGFFNFVSSTSVLAHEGENHFIEMKDDGFSASVLTIEKGESIIFINRDKLDHWPASDIHPTHGIYPEFDPKKPISPGSSWTFKFDKVGNWRFHDHLNPAAVGMVTVTGEVEKTPESKSSKLPSLREILDKVKMYITQTYYKIFPSKLRDLLGKTDMYSQAQDEARIIYWLKLIGPQKMMAELVTDTNGGSTYDCHQEAHKTGRIAYEIFGQKVFSEGDSSCHSGFYHGAMEAFLSEKGTLNLGENIREVCSSFPTTFGTFECLHGVGHGLMAYLNYDLPEGLTTCDELSTEYDRSSCYGGIFMENIVAALGLGAKPGHTTQWLNDDPHFPCNAVDTKQSVQVQCYLIQTSRMMQLFNNDFSKIAESCSTAPENMRNTCFQSLGRDLAGATLRNPDGILATCNTLPGEYYQDCVRGSVFVIVDFWGEKLQDQAYQLCQKISDSSTKKFCYSTIFGRLTDIYGNNRVAISKSCSYVKPDYKSLCPSF